MSRRHLHHRRKAISPVISSIILVGITVTLGLALWSYVNSQSNTATLTFAQGATDYVNFKNDRFTITNIGFNVSDPFHPNSSLCGNSPTPSPDGSRISKCVSIYVYNSGDVPITIKKVYFNTTDNINDLRQDVHRYCIDNTSDNKNGVPLSVTSPGQNVTIAPKTLQTISFHTWLGSGTCQGDFQFPNKSTVYYSAVETNNGSYQTAFVKYKVN